MTTSAYCKANITRLMHIFKQEAKLLRAGKLNDVMTLTPMKTNAMAEMEASFKGIEAPQSDPQLQPYLKALEKMGLENGRLLQSAIAGARAAKTRIEQLKYQHAHVGTYDSSGKKHSLAEDNVISKKIV